MLRIENLQIADNQYDIFIQIYRVLTMNPGLRLGYVYKGGPESGVYVAVRCSALQVVLLSNLNLRFLFSLIDLVIIFYIVQNLSCGGKLDLEDFFPHFFHVLVIRSHTFLF